LARDYAVLGGTSWLGRQVNRGSALECSGSTCAGRGERDARGSIVVVIVESASHCGTDEAACRRVNHHGR
jgi:hypothetical protein